MKVTSLASFFESFPLSVLTRLDFTMIFIMDIHMTLQGIISQGKGELT